MDRRITVVLGLVAAALVAGCARQGGVDTGPQAYYRTGFPARDVSGALERILESVVRTNVRGWYDTYVFAREEAPTEAEVLQGGDEVLARAADTVSSTSSRAATAIVIGRNEGRVTLLTADHGTHYPDTIFEHFGRPPRAGGPDAGPRPVETVSIKTRQSNSIVSRRHVEPFEVLARNDDDDIALLGVELDGEEEARDLPPLDLPIGDPGRLSWGSFVYVLGYPSGFRMVTRGIVSDPGRDRNASFLIDGLWNEGMSGAPIFAVRGEDGTLEWIGIARAASARTEHRLVPEEGAESEQEPRQPYEGPIYLEEVRRIQYGITLSVPMTAILTFFDAHRSIAGRGFALPSY